MKSIVFGDSFVGLSDAIYITLVSIGIVFSVLILICFFVSCMKYIPKAKEEGKDMKKSGSAPVAAKAPVAKVETKSEVVESQQVINYEDEKVRLAIMVASMEAAQEDENAWIRVRSVREII